MVDHTSSTRSACRVARLRFARLGRTQSGSSSASTHEPWLRSCGTTRSMKSYAQSLQESTWFLHFPGTMPASFHFADGVQSGTLPIVLIPDQRALKTAQHYAQQRTRCRQFATKTHMNTSWLPFVDLGLQWDDVGIIADASARSATGRSTGRRALG